ncbi:GNAT family N-acetyltransferase [Mesorhizobium sp.]|uniref:GNAT family N-acetyltransferase n=1 Tax=Mesorhizobium sp. TaxID=1871066 RepID=UPI003428664A
MCRRLCRRQADRLRPGDHRPHGVCLSADVIVWPGHRGRGIGTRLVHALIDHPDCKTVTHWSLSTNDAHAVYEKLGFRPSTDGSVNEQSYNPRLLQKRLTGWTRCAFGRSLAWRRVEASL